MDAIDWVFIGLVALMVAAMLAPFFGAPVWTLWAVPALLFAVLEVGFNMDKITE